MKIKETPEVASEVMIAESEQSKVKSAFLAERDSFQQEIETIAKAQKRDKYDVYASILFGQRLADRFEYAMSKRTKVLSGALSILIATGMDEAEAKRRLGLGE